MTQFGGRFGKDIDGSDINDDGISHRKEGGLKLQVQYETLSTGTSKVYATVLLGKQALVEAVSYEPKTVIGPVTDKLMRFRPAGWKGLLGWNVYRKEARYVIQTKSSIATA